MNFKFSKHATNQMELRGISKNLVTSILNHPDLTESQDEEVSIYMKLVTEKTKHYLYRVFVNILNNPALIITVYKTSKIEKYGYQI